MARRIYHKKSSSFGSVVRLAMLALVLLAGWWLWSNMNFRLGFNPDKLVEDSMLQNQGFSANVEEIVSREGIKAYYFEDHTNPIISISFMFKNAGRAFTPSRF